MPAWKTFDESTAAALKEHLGETAVSTVNVSGPLFDGGNSVLIAPTLQKGAVFVITAEAKQKLVIDEPTPQLQIVETLPQQPPVEAESALAPPIESEPVPQAEVAPAEPLLALESPLLQPKLGEIEDGAFGPTTWERADVDVVDPVSIPVESERDSEISSGDPEVWDLPSEPQQRWTDEIVAPAADDEHHVATGFLGLDDYVEDDEEIARAKRPWWKRIFTD